MPESLSLKDIRDVLNDEDFWAEMRALVLAGALASARKLVIEGATAAESAGVIFDFDAVHREAVAVTRRWSDDWWKKLDKTTRAGLREAILTWEEVGLGKRGLPDLIDAIEPLFGKMRAKRIAVTEATRLFAEGEKLAVRDDIALGGLIFSTAEDEKVCIICRPHNGHIYPKSNPVSPPLHVNCLSGDTLVSPIGRVTHGFERRYEGDLLFFRTARGNELAVTPNHPVLTDRGWMAAKLLQPGSGVTGCFDAQRMASRYPNDQNVPLPIKQIVRALGASGKMGFATVPTTPIDFHGDGRYGQVNVVGPASELRERQQAHLAQVVSHYDLQLAWPPFPLIHLGPLSLLTWGNLARSSGFVGRRNLCLPLVRRHLGPLQSLGLRLAPDMDASRLQTSADSPAVNAKGLRDLILTNPGLVEFDQVINVDVRSFRGHVYNLQTESGMYIGNGIITHNCRCALIPASWEFIRGEGRANWQGGNIPTEVQLLAAM